MMMTMMLLLLLLLLPQTENLRDSAPPRRQGRGREGGREGSRFGACHKERHNPVPLSIRTKDPLSSVHFLPRTRHLHVSPIQIWLSVRLSLRPSLLLSLAILS